MGAGIVGDGTLQAFPTLISTRVATGIVTPVMLAYILI
jgi:hypothetical protein